MSTVITNLKPLIEDAARDYIDSSTERLKSSVPGPKGLQGDPGISVHHIKPTNTTNPEGDFNSPGGLDSYTLYGDPGEAINLGYFNVQNGADPYDVALSGGYIGLRDDFNASLGGINAVVAEVTVLKDTTEASTASSLEYLQGVERIFDNFDDKYLGAKASDPVEDNDGDPLVPGQIYWDVVSKALKFFNGTAWESPSIQAHVSANIALESAAEAKASEDSALAYSESAGVDAATTAQHVSTTRVNADAAALSAGTAGTYRAEVAGDLVQVNLGVATTTENVVKTAADVVKTNADVVKTNSDVVSVLSAMAQTASYRDSASASKLQAEAALAAFLSQYLGEVQELPSSAPSIGSMAYLNGYLYVWAGSDWYSPVKKAEIFALAAEDTVQTVNDTYADTLALSSSIQEATEVAAAANAMVAQATATATTATSTLNSADLLLATFTSRYRGSVTHLPSSNILDGTMVWKDNNLYLYSASTQEWHSPVATATLASEAAVASANRVEYAIADMSTLESDLVEFQADLSTASNNLVESRGLLATFNRSYAGPVESLASLQAQSAVAGELAWTEGDLYVYTGSQWVAPLRDSRTYSGQAYQSSQEALAVEGRVSAMIDTVSGLEADTTELTALKDEVVESSDRVIATAGRFLPASANDPSSRLYGAILQTGDTYFNTSTKLSRVYDASTAGWTTVGEGAPNSIDDSTVTGASNTTWSSAKIMEELESLASSSEVATPEDIAGALVKILPPTIVSPKAGAMELVDTFVGSEYATSNNYIGAHAATDWEVSASDGFSSLAASSYENPAHKDTFTLAGIGPSATYYIRLRHKSSEFIGAWSEPVSFTSIDIYIESPVLVVDGQAEHNIGSNPMMYGGPFTINGSSEAHVSTDWFVRDTDNEIVWSSLGDTVNLESIQASGLEAGAPYVFECRYRSASYQSPVARLIGDPTAFLPVLEVARIACPAPANTYHNSGFGTAMVINKEGTRVYIGAPGRRVDGKGASGEVYEFTKDLGSWVLTTTFEYPRSRYSYTRFGKTLALSRDGSTLAVASARKDSLRKEGAVDVFKKTGSGWEHEATVLASATSTDRNDSTFGDSLGLSYTGDTLYVGHTRAIDSNATGGVGSVTVFKKGTTANPWPMTQLLLNPSSLSYSRFGEDIRVTQYHIYVLGSAISTQVYTESGGILTNVAMGLPNNGQGFYPNYNETVGVLRYYHTFEGQSYRDYARYFTMVSGTWVEQYGFAPEIKTRRNSFGKNAWVSDNGEVVLMPRPEYAGIAGNLRNVGEVDLMTLSSSGATPIITYSKATEGNHYDLLGGQVALSESGETAFVSRSGERVLGTLGVGAVYVYD